LGPGYREGVYERALAIELELRGISFEKQMQLELTYRGRPVGKGRIDFLVDGCLIVELKAVEALSALHTAQAISYLKATGHQLALVLNFNVPVLKAGIHRVVL
jgi:GxxExxY protein